MAIDQGATEIFCIILSPEKPGIEDVQYESLVPILERTISMFSEDVGENDLFNPEQFAKTLEYLNAVKQKMKAKGVSQSQVDDYFKIEGPANPLEAVKGLKLFIIRPDSPLGGGPGGLVFNPAEMKTMVSTGRSVAQDFAARLNPKDITWLV